MNIEILGYIATIIIALSFVLKDMMQLRSVNCTGALLYVIYGLMIESYPVALLNAFIVCVHCYYLFKMFSEKKEASNNS